ncbi:MAG: hypothetical protein K2K76_07410 [Muribaculaceae bacterium]|nr:hypothetical protein [Muribaculaceae bacterium]
MTSCEVTGWGTFMSSRCGYSREREVYHKCCLRQQNDLSFVCMYMTGNFKFTASWEATQKALNDDGAKNRLPSRFDIGASWYKGAWSVGLKLANIFRSNWNAGSTSLVTRYYEYERHNLGVDYHRSCMVSATYTFDYGKKKVDHTQDIRREAYSNSAILKK